MGTDSIHLALYVVAKFIAYTVWCALGMHLLRSSRRAIDGSATTAMWISPLKKWLLATGFGVLRLLMGILFGILIWLLCTMVASAIVAAPGRDVITYLLVYVPVRWVEWTILAWLIARGNRETSWLFQWRDTSSRWRRGGILISCVADIPIIAMTDWMLPIGRFFC